MKSPQNLLRVGYWAPTPAYSLYHEADKRLPQVNDFVNPSWDRAERSRVISYVKYSDEFSFIQYRGMSRCRICDKYNGSRCFFDDVYRWPEGLSHYLEEHYVKPPQDFVDHVLKMMHSNDVLKKFLEKIR